MTNREIAERSGVSRNGIKFHVANVLGKLGLADRKALRQWFQPPKGSALEQKEKTVVTSPGLGPIAQISRTVGDIQEAQRWYGQVLGLRHLYTFGKLAFFDCGGTRLFLSQETASPTSESVIYFRVDDIEATHKTLVGRGVEFINAPHMIHRHSDGTEEWLAIFKDPEGRPLAIMAQVKRPA
jgi:predicted enzyme related to lactoylglutathione lyase